MAGLLRLLVLLVVTAVRAQRPASTSAYCAMSSSHTMCRYGGPDPRRCGLVRQSGLDQREQQLVVQLHNERRSLVAMGGERRGAPGPQPPAANMRQLAWDDELAAVAQRWAEQCNFKHDCGTCRAVSRFQVGQNLYVSIHSAGSDQRKAHWERAIESWYSEVADFSRRDVSSFPRSERVIGHYTQMLWAETSRIGCGFVRYQTGNRDNRMYVCNYGRVGNVLSRPVYRQGSACSLCPTNTGCSRQYRGLCAPTGTTGSQDGTHTTHMPGMPARPGMPGMNEMPGMSGMPGMNEMPGMPGMLGMNEMPGMPEMPEMSGVLNRPGTTSMPGATLMPDKEVYVVQPDPNSGCFTFAGYIFCGKGRARLVVVKNPFA